MPAPGCSPAYDPYGSTYDPAACNTADLDATAPWRAGGHPTCQGGFEGIFDMSGNLREWEGCETPDATDGAGTDYCGTRGGEYTLGSAYGAQYLRCDNGGELYFHSEERSFRSSQIGFRCCAD